jgi:3D (Asp-Asp-Asp) domain-containing protein
MRNKKQNKDKYFYTVSLLLTCYGFLLVIGTIASISLHTKIQNRKVNTDQTNINYSQAAPKLDQNLDQKDSSNTRIISIELPAKGASLSTEGITKDYTNIAQNDKESIATNKESITEPKASKSESTENRKDKKSVVNANDISIKKDTKRFAEQAKQNKPVTHKQKSVDTKISETVKTEKSNPLGKIAKWASAPQLPQLPQLLKLPKMPWDVNKKDKEQKPVLKERHKASPKNIARKEKPTKAGHPKKMLARVTVYWAHGSGTDKWSAKKQSSTGTRLECGQHAAVDPKVIPYGSKLEVQKYGREVVVKAVDTGSAVKKRKAAIAMAKNDQQKKAPVIDLFFEKKSDALHYAKNNPPYQWVEVHP